MVYGSPTSNRIQIYLLNDFSHPKSSTCSANLNSGVFEKLIFLKILFGQIIFVRKYYVALYTWHDHWAEAWGKETKYRRWSCVDFKEHLKKTQRENQLQIKAK